MEPYLNDSMSRLFYRLPMTLFCDYNCYCSNLDISHVLLESVPVYLSGKRQGAGVGLGPSFVLDHPKFCCFISKKSAQVSRNF